MKKPTLIERVRWLFFQCAIKATASAGFLMSLVLIAISAYGLLSEEPEHQRTGLILGIPSVFIFIYTTRLLRLSNFSAEEVNKWYSRGKE